MDELTLLIFPMASLLFIVMFILRRREVCWLTFFTGVCAIGQVILDESLTEMEMVIMLVIALYIMFISGLKAFMGTEDEGGRSRRRRRWHPVRGGTDAIR
jgi:hypothetical protein